MICLLQSEMLAVTESLCLYLLIDRVYLYIVAVYVKYLSLTVKVPLWRHCGVKATRKVQKS